MNKQAASDVHVIGAGIVGVCCALYLQRLGYAVTIISRDAPGRSCSFGNSGGLWGGLNAAALLAPKLFRNIPRQLADPRHPLSIRLRDAPGLVPWALHLLRSGRPDRRAGILDARWRLLGLSRDGYEPFLPEIERAGLFARPGSLVVYESEALFRGSAQTRKAAQDHGISVELLEGGEISRLNPALGPRIRYAAHLRDHQIVVNPGRLVSLLADIFVAAGGRLIQETVLDFDYGASGPLAVVTDQGRHACQKIVVAAGAWSGAIAARLKQPVLLAAQRGYHAEISEPAIDFPMATLFADCGVMLTRMETGLRITGIAEFAAPDAPADFRHIDRIVEQAAAYVPGLETKSPSRWMGCRPSTPDSLPVIGRSTAFPNVFFAFGHDQNGLQLGGITGRLVAELVSGAPPSLPLDAYAPGRF